MDLSKAFDSLNHELLIAKLDSYGFSKSALKLMISYLRDRKQRVRVNESYSAWKTTKKLEFHKVQSWDPFYSIVSLSTCFISWVKQRPAIMQMILLSTLVIPQ